ncbi:MAG: NADH:flavin oxidoreductase [Myxococcota bacterium]
MTLLSSPMTFRGGRSAPNRIWVAPMTNGSSHRDGRLSDDEYGFLTARAAGGFAVVETCATHVHLDGQGWEGELGIFDDRHIEGWRRLADGVHEHGALLFGQAFHGGRRALRGGGRPAPWSCSATDSDPALVAADESRIERVISDFAHAARRLERAGADGVELHGAHDYLLCQFLRADFNRRDDAWGGDLAGRARLIRHVMRAVRAAVSERFIVGARLSPESYGRTTGLDLDESVEVASWLCEDGADFIHLSLWDASKNTQKRPDVHAAQVFRDALPAEIPVITAGNMWTLDDARAQLDLGADAVALGRAAIANPDWPRAVVSGGLQPKRPPLGRGELRERALGPAFVDYMTKWPGFVKDEPPA